MFYFVILSIYYVAPYVGAWIETPFVEPSEEVNVVAPYVGAWIETVIPVATCFLVESHPTWVRGLKLYGIPADEWSKLVAPYVGAWIETSSVMVSE